MLISAYSKVIILYIYMYFFTLFQNGLSQDIEYNSLSCTSGPCYLPILCIILCIWKNFEYFYSCALIITPKWNLVTICSDSHLGNRESTSVSTDLPTLVISYRWNHTLCGLLCLFIHLTYCFWDSSTFLSSFFLFITE